MKKKAQGDTLVTIKNAILVLLVLVVLIAVFYTLTKGPITGILGIEKETGTENLEKLESLKNMFGGCDPDVHTTDCSYGKVFRCSSNGLWETEGEECEN